MLLAVAGLKNDEVQQRMKLLASGDWSSFPAYERLAYHFAFKLTREPASIRPSDLQELARTFGTERATDLIWYISWCNYMTRVADACQFNLERDNVFASPPPGKKEQPDSKSTSPKSEPKNNS